MIEKSVSSLSKAGNPISISQIPLHEVQVGTYLQQPKLAQQLNQMSQPPVLPYPPFRNQFLANPTILANDNITNAQSHNLAGNDHNAKLFSMINAQDRAAKIDRPIPAEEVVGMHSRRLPQYAATAPTLDTMAPYLLSNPFTHSELTNPRMLTIPHNLRRVEGWGDLLLPGLQRPTFIGEDGSRLKEPKQVVASEEEKVSSHEETTRGVDEDAQAIS
jgi:hypothetical protein